MQAPLLHEGGLAWQPERVSTMMVVFYVIHHRGSEKITIHALRGEGDVHHQLGLDDTEISIHALRGEGDPTSSRRCRKSTKFLSTPSVGRATQRLAYLSVPASFLSTPSVGRATPLAHRAQPRPAISIHALRGEGDFPGHQAYSIGQNFYPRPPWGGRRGC